MIEDKEFLLAQYSEFLDALNKITVSEVELKHFQYGWIPSVSNKINWFIYNEYLRESANSLANLGNEFLNMILELEAWNEVYSKHHNIEVRFALISHFIRKISTLTLNLPSVMRDRLLYSSAHLCHQFNRRTEHSWSEDKLPMIEKYISIDHVKCPKFPDLANDLYVRIKAVNSLEYQNATLNFRNLYQHRLPPYISLGIVSIIQRTVPENLAAKDSKGQKVTTNKRTYRVANMPPLDLKDCSKWLRVEYHSAHQAYESFQQLIIAQLSHINSCISN